jgi:hypothetical protein
MSAQASAMMGITEPSTRAAPGTLRAGQLGQTGKQEIGDAARCAQLDVQPRIAAAPASQERDGNSSQQRDQQGRPQILAHDTQKLRQGTGERSLAEHEHRTRDGRKTKTQHPEQQDRHGIPHPAALPRLDIGQRPARRHHERAYADEERRPVAHQPTPPEHRTV